MALEEFRADAMRCTRCTYCRWIPFDLVKSNRFAKGCPSMEAGKFHAYSAGGRLVTQMRVDVLGAGPHLVDLARIAPIGPGVYFIRLMHGGRGATTRVAVVR